MKKRAAQTPIKVLLTLILIPVLGIGLPFGCAHVYGRVSHVVMRSRAENCLTLHEPALDEIMANWYIKPVGLDKLGLQSAWREDGAWVFQFPYDSAKLLNWVPCGLMYCEDLSNVEPWRKTEPIKENWYFYWDT